MSIFFTLLIKELRAFFFSPVAYIIIALVMVLSGVSFRAAVSILETAPSEGSIVTWTFHATWFWLSYFFIFPLLTMRLFAEEKKLGTIETLLTAPVSVAQVVTSKYLAACILYSLVWLPVLFNFLFLRWLTGGQVEVPGGALLGSMMILAAMGVFNLAMGCFASALTSNQIVAAILSFTLSILHFLLGLFVLVIERRIPAAFVDFVHYIASVEHIRWFTQGLIDSRPLVYYSSLAALFLFFTHHIIAFQRWRP